MKLVLSFVTISLAAAASHDGSFIRGSTTDSSAATATHEVPTDIFAGLANGNNNFTPQEYCPRGTDYNPSGPEWPAESGCYPVSTRIDALYSHLRFIFPLCHYMKSTSLVATCSRILLIRDAAPLIHRELDQSPQVGLSAVKKATVPIIHALFVKTQWQVLLPTVLICPLMKIAT